MRDRRLWFMGVFGFLSGLPYPLSGFTLNYWLSSSGVSNKVVGLTAMIGLAYTLKFLWSPVLDGRAPVGWLGRRRGWLVIAQPLLAVAVAMLALGDPGGATGAVFAAAAAVAFLSASQDIVIDAWRIETFSPEEQGGALAAYVTGYRVALLVSGSLVFWAAKRVGWQVPLLGLAGLMAVGALVSLAAPEPVRVAGGAGAGGIRARVREAVVAPLRDFVGRPGAWTVLAYVALFYLGEALAGKMLAPLYRHLGFGPDAVAAIGPFSLVATLGGYAFGAWVIRRIGVKRALIVTGFTQTGFLALYVVLTLRPGDYAMLYATVLAEAFVQSMAVAAFVAYLSGLCELRFTATQYALLTSVAALSSHTVGGLSGYAADALGWTAFYAVAMFSAVPSMVLMMRIIKKF